MKKGNNTDFSILLDFLCSGKRDLSKSLRTYMYCTSQSGLWSISVSYLTIPGTIYVLRVFEQPFYYFSFNNTFQYPGKTYKGFENSA